MKNIIFIDREGELNFFKEVEDSSFFVVVKGRRRIGKTTLIRKAFPDAAYLFVWPNKSIDWITGEICREYALPKFSKLVDIVAYFLDKDRVVIFDEFQNFLSVDKSFYGEMQKLIDERKLKKERFRIIVSGSSYSLIGKVFSREASPLYGRRTHEITLGELPPEEIISELKLDIEEFIKIWSIFGGVPYYYEITDLSRPIEDSIRGHLKRIDSIIIDEGRVVLSVEFGEYSKTYGTVLTAIAEGKTKLNEIASLFSNRKTETTKYIDLLRKEFNLIKRVTPIISDPRKSKEGIYLINDNFLSFWFFFIDNKKAYIEQNRVEELVHFFEANFNNFVGRKFEDLIMYAIKKQLLFRDLKFTKIGRQWGKIPAAPKNTYEIDILALNEETKEILFCECKWQDKVDVKKILQELKEKARYVKWHDEKRKEHYAIFAKSYKEKIKEPGVMLFDAEELEKIFSGT